MSEEEQKIEIVDASNNDGASVSVDVESILNPPEEEVQENTITVPDKFKNEDGSVNSDALLKSYLALEKGEATPEETPEVTPEALEETTGFKLDDYYAKWEKGEAIDEADVTTISEGMNIPADLVKAYVDMYSERQTNVQSGADGRIYDTVGGEEKYNDMVEWAGKSLDDTQLEALNVQLDNPVFAEKGASLLKALYEGANGSEPQVRIEPSAQDVGDSLDPGEFQSEGEVREAQRDPKYRSGDPRTHREFDAKFARFKARQRAQ